MLRFVIIPSITFLVGWLGQMATNKHVRDWYPTLRKPSWTPPGAVIGLVWTTIFALTTVSALIVWNGETFRSGVPFSVAATFALNAVLNVSWSFVFFYNKQIGAAIPVSAALDATVVLLIRLIRPASPVAAWLLVPYAAWVAFATFLNFLIWKMNRT